MKHATAVTIESIGSFVPQRRVTNDQLAEFVDTSDQWIRSHTGIGARHLAEDATATSDLAVQAALDAIERSDLTKEDIDGIIVATATPDYVGFPSTACIIQDKLGLNGIAALDVVAGCTGFIYGLEVARGMILGGTMHHVLVIGAEKLSSIVNWKDRNTCVLFGDGAGCAILSASGSADERRGIKQTILYADGSGADCLIVPRGGSKAPLQGVTVAAEDVTIAMEGRKVYNFAVAKLAETIKTLMEDNDLTIDDVDRIIPHQANSRIIQAAANRLKIPMEKFFVNIEDYANTSAASIPIALKNLEDQKGLKKGDRIIIVGFGAGLTSGGSLLVW
jgi:3-oxoacyl-[acyl-carrier-protein] synthase III